MKSYYIKYNTFKSLKANIVKIINTLIILVGNYLINYTYKYINK